MRTLRLSGGVAQSECSTGSRVPPLTQVFQVQFPPRTDKNTVHCVLWGTVGVPRSEPNAARSVTKKSQFLPSKLGPFTSWPPYCWDELTRIWVQCDSQSCFEELIANSLISALGDITFHLVYLHVGQYVWILVSDTRYWDGLSSRSYDSLPPYRNNFQ